MAVYATDADVYRQGIPSGALLKPARVAASADATGNTITLAAHGLELDDAITFTVDEGGVLPAPLATATVYYAIPVSGSDSLFQVATSEGGAAVNLTTAGTAVFRVAVPLSPALAALRETYSRWVDGLAIGHTVPFESPYPAWATHLVAIRTAAQAARMLGLSGERATRIFEAEAMAIADGMRLAKGPTLRDDAATAGSNLAVGRSVSTTTRDTEALP